MCKTRIGVIFGGRSQEHEVSLLSAATVIKSLNSDKFVPIYIGITRNGEWKKFCGDVKFIQKGIWEDFAEDFSLDDLKKEIDFALPILHGTYGEDGCIQGLLEIMGIPYGGCGVLASAIAMDKWLFKELLKSRELPVCRFLGFDREEICANKNKVVQRIAEEIGFPCFIKPSNMGSSVGISKALNEEQLELALDIALTFDRRIVVEEFVPCRELEIAIIGNDKIESSHIGEIIASKDFYDYEAKYSDKIEPAKLMIPADIEADDRRQIIELAKRAYRAIDGSGYGRVDFFKHKETGEIYINEINTIPGFTSKSMFPLLWEKQGIKLGKIIERILELGYERYNAEDNR